MNISIFPNLIYSFNAITIKIPRGLVLKIELDFKTYMEDQRQIIVKAFLKSKLPSQKQDFL